jgi:hypothetical protein
MKQDVRKTLRAILEYIGADLKYAEYADLQSMLERLIIRNVREDRREK